jgi:hypothetical protein
MLKRGLTVPQILAVSDASETDNNASPLLNRQLQGGRHPLVFWKIIKEVISVISGYSYYVDRSCHRVQGKHLIPIQFYLCVSLQRLESCKP